MNASNDETRFRVRVTNDALVFSAAHFITYAGNICERLHGHNWRTSVEVEGALDENRYVFDFIALRESLAAIVRELDHHVLLPTRHPLISVRQIGREVEAAFAERRWVFPLEDCVLLPVENTTAELIAHWIAGRLSEEISRKSPHSLTQLEVGVEENFGQWAICKVPLK